jgi:PAS domain S-box-containing protein
MKIKNQFIISIVFFTVILLVIAASVAATEQQVNQLKNQEAVSGSIEQGASNLNSLAIDYFLYQQDTQLSQWQSTHSALYTDLSNLKLTTAQQQTLANKVSGDLKNLNSSFGEVVSFLQTAPRNVSVRIDPVFQQKWSNMATQGSTLTSDAAQLSSALDSQARQANVTNTVLIISLMVTFGAFLATIYLIVFRRTLKSVAELKNGINTVSAGNLDYVIQTKRQDEVSELSFYFNQMTANLKRAEQKVLDASFYSRSLIEASLDPLVTISSEGKITDVNKATEDVTGHSRQELIGSDFSNYFTEPEEARAGYRKVFTEGLVKDYPLAIRHKSGRITDVLYNASVYRNPQGEIQGVFAAARDITERKVAEEKIRAASLYARSLIEASLDPLVTISPEGKITDVNQATEEVTGYSREQLVESDFSDYFTEPEKARAGYKQVFTDGFVKDYPLAIRSQSGKITDVLYNATVYRDADGNVQGVFAAARDVTERNAIENELRQTLEKLKQSNAELEQFAYVASHDLQEPLRMVASYVQLLQRRYKGKLDSDADEFIAYAVDGANRMRGLIDDLLTYSRVSRLGKPFEPTNLESTMQIVLSNLQVSISETNATVTHDKLPLVVADSGQMVQLLQNLIGNAIKFHRKEPPRVHVSAKAQGGEYLFSVSDNGIGIDSQYFDRLFKIFQRLHTKEEYPGSGIGLVICKRIVERHGGRIWFESQVGKGSTIYFTLNKKRE